MTSGKKGGAPVIFSLRGVYPGSSQKEYPRFFRVHVCGSEGIQVRMRDYGYQRKHPREVPLQKPVRKIIVSEEKPSFQNYEENTGFGRRAFVLIFARFQKAKRANGIRCLSRALWQLAPDRGSLGTLPQVPTGLYSRSWLEDVGTLRNGAGGLETLYDLRLPKYLIQ